MRHLVRRLARAPLFTSVTVATLAIAIGANTAIFSVLDGVLLKPLPYPHPDQLVGLWHTAPGVNITDLNSAPLSIQPWAQLLVRDADNPQQFATDVKESELPILARRRLSQSSPLIQARVACDQLQADLAPLGDFAGYLV